MKLVLANFFRALYLSACGTNFIHQIIRRRIQFLLALPLLASQCFGQTDIQVVIKNTGGHAIDKVDAFDLSQKEFVDLTYKDTLHFKFTKTTTDCYIIRYHQNGKMFRQQLWLNAGHVKIEAHIDSTLVIDTVFNAPVYYEQEQFKKDHARLYHQNDTAAMAALLLQGCSKNSNSPYALVFAEMYLRLQQNSKAALLQLKALTDQQGDRFSWFLLYPAVIGQLNDLLNKNVVNIAEYRFINRQNRLVPMPALKSTYTILDFWFLGCAPCRSDHKEIFKSRQLLAAKNATVISISTDRTVVPWKKYLSSNRYNWPNYMEAGSQKITTQFHVGSFPTYMVINAEGAILCTQNSFSEILRWLNKQ